MEYNGHELRHEYKYIINSDEYLTLKTILSSMMAIDPYNGPEGYHIRSLYFDDVYSTAHFEKESGTEFRQKYRIRIYNSSDKVIKLERKEKYSEYISKIDESITKEQFYEIINDGNLDFMLNSDRQLFNEFYIARQTRLLRPAVIVDYHRDTLVCNEGNVRISFDKNIQAGIDSPDIFSDNVTVVSAYDPNTMVLEVKYDDYIPKYIKKAIKSVSHRQEAASKYIYCRDAQFKYNPAFGSGLVY